MFVGPNCNIPLCVTGSCFNGGTCFIQNDTLRCQCPCGFTGKEKLSKINFEICFFFIKDLDVKHHLIYVH